MLRVKKMTIPAVVLALVLSASPVLALPTLNWVETNADCIARGESVIVYANVTLPVPCYAADFKVTFIEFSGDYEIVIEFIPQTGPCLQVITDTIFAITVLPHSGPHDVLVEISGIPGVKQTSFHCVHRGDLNGNSVEYEIADAIMLINFGFAGQQPFPEPIGECWQVAADMDGNQRFNLVDIVLFWWVVIGRIDPPSDW